MFVGPIKPPRSQRRKRKPEFLRRKTFRILLSILPGIFVAAFVFSANVYYDLDQGTGTVVFQNDANLSNTTASHLTVSDLTASRLLASDANKALVSTDLSSWVSGTTNQITVTDNGDGTITLSTPQDIATSSSPTFSGLTLSSLTQGSVLFAGSSGTITEDNSNLYFDDTNKRLGIATNSPETTLDIAGTAHLRGAAGGAGLYVDSNGNVGIGTTEPSEKLTVEGNLRFPSSSGGIIMADNGLIFETGVALDEKWDTQGEWEAGTFDSTQAQNGVLKLSQPSSTIGTGTSAQRAPIDAYYNYHCNGAIYLQSEIGNAGTITKIRWYIDKADPDTVENVTIYMSHTSDSSWTSAPTCSDLQTGTLVYSGTLTPGSSEGWYEVTLDTPFSYNGVDNLIISVRHQDGSWESSSTYRYTDTGDNKFASGSSDSNNPPSLSLSHYRPNIQLVYSNYLSSGSHTTEWRESVPGSQVSWKEMTSVVTLPTSASASATIRVSDDGSTIKDSKTVTLSNGTNTYDISDLQPGRYLSIVSNLSTTDDSQTPEIDSYEVVSNNTLHEIMRLVDSSVGIGTTSPDYTLDVDGNIRASLSLTAGINVETLSGDKTLTPGTDEMYQWLDPNGANRTITLDTSSAKAGDKFIIRNNGAYDDSYYLEVKQGSTTLDYIFAQSIREYIFDGTNWVSGDAGTGVGGDKNVAIGCGAEGFDSGTAIGYGAKITYNT